MTKQFLRLDVMSGNRDNTQVKSGMYYKDGAVAEVENGVIVGIGALLDGERELHKVEDVTDEDVLVGIISTPEVEYEERGYHGIETFSNEAGVPVRVHVLHEGDFFSLGNSKFKADIPCGSKLVAKHMGSEVCGRYTYECFEVRAK